MRPSFSNFTLVIVILLKKVNLEVNWKVKCVGSCANGPKHLRQAWMMTLASESGGQQLVLQQLAAGPLQSCCSTHPSQGGERGQVLIGARYITATICWRYQQKVI